MAASPESLISLPTAADVDAAAQRLAGVALAHAAGDLAGARRPDRRAQSFSRPRPCSAPARSSSAAPTTSCASIPLEQRAGGVVAYSSGNHAQGVAAAARLLGMPAVIVMPPDAPRPKRERTAALGAEVVLYDREREDREAIARDDRRASAARCWCRPMTMPLIIAGQGTAGREIVEDLAALGLCARRRRGHRVRRRPHCGHRARGQGAGAAGARSIPPSRRASTTTRARSGAASARRTRRSPAPSATR